MEIKSDGFILPELIIESVIRDGLQNVKSNTTIIPDIFKQLTRNYNSQKYGTSEITKIQTLLNAKEIPVVYSYTDVDAKAPCFSIMVGGDDEARSRDHLGDFYGQETDAITDVQQLADLIVVPNFAAISYNPVDGKVSVPDDVDLTPVYKGFVFVGADDVEHIVERGISNIVGDKFFYVGRNEDVDISDMVYIKSPLAYTETEVRGVTGDVKMVIGVHAKDALTTKYLYILLKYFILSRKPDIIARGLYLAMYNGSDFNRNQEYLGDRVFTRFLTISGKVDDTWKQDQVELIDAVIINGTPIE